MRVKNITALLLAGTLFIATKSLSQAEEATTKTQTVEERLQALEQRNAILERKVENDQEAAAAKAKEGASVVAGKDGFALKSTDGAYQLKIGGYIQVDYRAFLADEGAFPDQFLIRRARLIIDGDLGKDIDFRLQPDFASAGSPSGGPTLQDAYADLKYISTAKIRVGKFTPPVSLERLQSSANLELAELALTQNLVPNRDTGVQFNGDFWKGALAYQAGVFNGVVDGGVSESDTNSGKDYIGRIFAQPFINSGVAAAKKIGLGISGSIGDQLGSATSSNLPAFKTDGQNTFFSYKTGAIAKGQRTRVNPQAYWYFGPVGLVGDFVSSDQEVALSTTATASQSFNNQAWQVELSWVVTGEDASFKGVKPRKIFDPKAKTWGALELAGRYAVLNVDATVFSSGASNISTSAKNARAITGGFNWYLNNNLKVTSDYAYTRFTGGAANGEDRQPERVIESRVQVSF